MTDETPFSLESFLGEKLLTKVGKPEKKTADLMKGKELVALYFSASWCPPCKAFSPILADFYQKYANDGKLEIVYVSSDKTVEEFDGYYGKMPWLSIPATGTVSIKRNLAETFGIMGIPTLVIMTSNGEFVTSSGREQVMKVGKDGNGKTLIDDWKAMETKPLSEAASSASAGAGPLMKLLMFFARNPMYIIGLMYTYKFLVKKFKELSGDDHGEL